ncbi:UDP-N-acetylmuramoyl-L-alanyl-D-glutamate--2,6-diaminopimelate ligase [Sporosarcina sp. A2]|uniref:UDP-N-acetylmuramoyl-L-alanyl-D-glutamate--2, 6-diaminopimelate ligase n=1 Tax=Sporosarcina sp. A2 TaxID=3393449 RepID=UPI003D78B5AA
MYLIELLKDWPCTIKGKWRDVSVETVTEHPERITEKSLFFARKGAQFDGLDSVCRAIEMGAAAIIIDRTVSENKLAQWCARGATIVTVPDCKKFLSHCSAQLAGEPAKELTIVAVTGTNGKTTVTHFIGQLLTHFGVKVAVLGTTGCFINGEKVEEVTPQLTTLTAEYLHPLLRKCVDRGVTHIALEASSLGLEMDRLMHCRAAIGVYLNIGEDHFDEHGGKKSYIQAKKILTTLSETLLVNCEDVECMNLVKDAGVPIQLFGRNVANGFMPSEELVSMLPPGEHNRLNAMAAASVVNMLGFSERKIFEAFDVLTLPEGRMQRLPNLGREVYIDYAHTPDALLAVLQAMKSLNPRKLICLFGCGGNRDKQKRPLMGKIAEEICDVVVLTSDNPRSEDPAVIVEDIMRGVQNPSSILVEVDRKKAIHQAIVTSDPGDIILIAGKGHEKVQFVAGVELVMSDYEEALSALKQLETVQE